TVVMKEDLLTLNERGLQMPVILGGAALTRRYVEEDLRRLYKGPLYYGADAFAGLHIMDELCAPGRRRAAGSVGLAALKPRAMPALERLKRLCIEEKILRPAAAYGFFPCAADGNDLIVYEDDRTTERLRFRFPRQDHGEYLCLADYFRPADGRATDVVAFMAV